MTPQTIQRILIGIAALFFAIVFLMGFGVIIDKQPIEELAGLTGLGLFFFALGHL